MLRKRNMWQVTCSLRHEATSSQHHVDLHAWSYRRPIESYPTQLNRELRTQVSKTSKSASLWSSYINEHYHFVTSSDRFPVPVRSAVKSNLTTWCCQNLFRKEGLNKVGYMYTIYLSVSLW